MAALASNLGDTFSTSPLKPLNGIYRYFTGSKISTSSTKFFFLGPIGKTKWPPWPLSGWDIFYFSSETAERNSTKLERKQDLNTLYQVCVLRVDRKIKMPLRLLIGWDIFDFSSATAVRSSTKPDRKQNINVLYLVCVFLGRWVNKNGRPSRSFKKVANCTQVHDMWPFGSLVT